MAFKRKRNFPYDKSDEGKTSEDVEVEISSDDEVMAGDDAKVAQGGQLEQTFKCQNCAANMVFKPGGHTQVCEYCGHENAIATNTDDIKELDYRSFLEQSAQDEALYETQQIITCSDCAAQVTADEKQVSHECPFCGTEIVTSATSKRHIKPKGILPFKITRDEAWQSFGNWINGLWFAPNDLKKFASREGKLAGMYVPYWTYDCDTVSCYVGMRGEYYYTTESYSVTVNGKSQRRTRRKRHTRWWPASGTIFGTFDDVLILASDSLPQKNTEKLEPWDLENLVDYDDAYLSGFKAEHYKVDLATGFGKAIMVMDDVIRDRVKRDIGGDVQRVTSIRTQHDHVTFKHLLLPIWLSAYRYNGHVFRFMINARTGEVQGDRPYSWVKITLAVVAGLVVAGGIAMMMNA